MKIVSYDTILRKLVALQGIQYDDLQDEDENNLRQMITSALRMGWEHFQWPELRYVEARVPDSNGFIPYEAPATRSMYTVFGVWYLNPNLSPGNSALGHILTQDGIQMQMAWSTDQNGQPKPVYVQFAEQAPELSGDVYDNDHAYVPGDQVLFTTPSGKQYFYRCLTATTGNPPTAPINGNSPTGDSLYWQIICIPFILSEYVVMISYATWLVSCKRTDEATVVENKALELLQKQTFRIESQEYQQSLMPVYTHQNRQIRNSY